MHPLKTSLHSTTLTKIQAFIFRKIIHLIPGMISGIARKKNTLSKTKIINFLSNYKHREKITHQNSHGKSFETLWHKRKKKKWNQGSSFTGLFNFFFKLLVLSWNKRYQYSRIGPNILLYPLCFWKTNVAGCKNCEDNKDTMTTSSSSSAFCLSASLSTSSWCPVDITLSFLSSKKVSSDSLLRRSIQLELEVALALRVRCFIL